MTTPNPLLSEPVISYADVKAAAGRIAGLTRPVGVFAADAGEIGAADGWFAYEFSQHTGSFKARGAANFTAAHVETGDMPEAGVVIASGGNAGLACAWAARRCGVGATVFLPENAPAVKVAKLRSLGADIHQVGTEYATALEASRQYAADTGAILSHAYDNPLIAAGAGTLMEEIHAALPALDTVVVAVGGGGLFSGVAAAAHEHGVRVVAAEPEHCRALNASIEAGHLVDVPVDSVAADSLGARRVSAAALDWARRTDCVSVLVPDSTIVTARQGLWDQRRLAVEHAASTALAAVRTGAYTPDEGERVCVVLCGANTDPGDLVARA
ncbi:threonine/serine dehydratase [Streptomyces sp. NPDC091292]|uniref:threonine/serine dehydratase n=1 Tax=Streptomyces sp. NPDC091292 TaxID=3365991 RepID=UPI003824A6ED